MQKRNILHLILFLLSLSVVGCSVAPLKEHHGKEVYTKIGMWIDKGRHLTANYKQGTFIPANARLEIASSSDKSINLRIPNERVHFKVFNRRKHTNLDIRGVYERYFSPKPIKTRGLKDFEIEAIKNGEIKKEMSKEAVLMARGYPPAHRTPSTERDEWIYWERSRDRIRVEFENGKVAYIID